MTDEPRARGMDPIIVETFSDVDVNDALVVVAFHGVGAAGPIAASYLHQHLTLPLVGHVRADGLGPVVHVSNGIATGPIRVYGGETICNLDGGCPRLYVILAELPVPLEMSDALAEAVLAWASGAKLLVCLDSATRSADDGTPDVFAFAHAQAALDKLAPTQAAPLQNGIIVGTTATFLMRSPDHHIDAAALLVEAAESHPDGRAAAALIEALDKLVPEIKVDPNPLLDEALEIEGRLAKSLEKAATAQPVRPPHTFI